MSIIQDEAKDKESLENFGRGRESMPSLDERKHDELLESMVSAMQTFDGKVYSQAKMNDLIEAFEMYGITIVLTEDVVFVDGK